MKKPQKRAFSFEQDLNFENLSQLLNDIGITSHPLTNEQKVCIEYPNISSESKNINIINSNQQNPEKENTKETKVQNEFTLILSKAKNFTIDVNKLFKRFKKDFPYSEEVFKNSIKIFVSIYNNYNEDLFKWNLEDVNLFNSSNKIQFFLINDIINNKVSIIEEIDKLYKEHLEYNNNELNINNVEKKEKIKDDFDEDDFEENIEIIGKDNNEEEIVLRNIYFLMNLFNLMNYFCLQEFSINNLMRNISLLNSYIINDIKILILIYFNLCIQINLTLSKQSIDNFLGISSPDNKPTTTISSVSSAINTISKSINLNFFSNDNDKMSKNNNTYIPSLYFIDSFLLKENENDIEKDKIILFNFIIKTHIWTYFIRNKICLKIFIKIFNLEKLSPVKKEFSLLQKLENKEKIFDLIKTINYVNLLSDNLSKENFVLMNADFNLVHDLNLGVIDDFFNSYFPVFINCNMISFEINNQHEFCTLNDYIEELNMIIWLFKFYLKIKKYKFKKHTFTFLSNSFSLAFKKNKEKKLEESYTKEITLFMSINSYKTFELIKYLSDIKNFNGVYKLYKLIIKSCNEYKTYDIGIRLFKEDIQNKELNYYIAMIVLKLQNYINTHLDLYKKLVLYENKMINPLDCVYLNIKKKLLTMKNKENIIQLKEKEENNVLNKLSKIDFIGLLKKNGNDSNAEKNSDNLYTFSKRLIEIGFNNVERDALYKFVNDDKYYFKEFLVYFTSNIISSKSNKSTFQPLYTLNHFTNNKCFFIIVENSILDVYLYLTDSFEMSIVETKEEKEKNDLNKKSIFFNAIMANLKLLKFVCKENFENKKCHLILRNVNIIINKSTLLQQDLFYDYKSLFSEDNIIYVLDEYTKTNCVFGKRSISLSSNLSQEEDSGINKDKYYENYFTAFYSMFLNSYGIIKFINDKKLRKFNKLNIVYNNKILQIKEGKIQIKKIENENEEKKNELLLNNIISEETEKIINLEQEENKDLEINKQENDINNEKEINENFTEDNMNKCINYNILKINELFHYQNSYPLLSFILLKESEISNLSFLFYSFEEIFLSKKDETIINKQTISKKITKFFTKFKSSNFIPIIFDQKYFFNFLKFFEKLINKKENNSHHCFQNLVLFIFGEENNNQILDKIKEKKIFENFVKKMHIFKIISGYKYNKNIFGRMFKFNRVIRTMKYFWENCEKKEENEGNIVLYSINEEMLDNIVKKNNKNYLGNTSDDNKENLSMKEDECLIF